MSRNDRQSRQRIREEVREGYAKIAESGGSCCGPGIPAEKLARQIGYLEDDLAGIPQDANMGLSCGNPTALAELEPGQVVLDLGSGAGLDVFIAARKVGPKGRVIGVDMTPEMLAKARNAITLFTKKTGLENLEFRLGEIEHLPVADNSIDVVISNCVINLSPDKQQVWREIFRVLRPGAKACVSDLALKEALPESLKKSAQALIGCISGAVTVHDTVTMIRNAGLARVHTREKPYNLDFMDNCNDALYNNVRDTLPPGKKLADYVVSVDFVAHKNPQ